MAKKLILAATINATKCSMVSLKDEQERRRQYIEVLGKYLKNTNLDLIFIENSGSDISFLKKIYKDFEHRIEYISFNGNQGVEINGKGHGERNSLRYALQNSEFLKNEKFFFKVSGRYFSKEIEPLINKVNTEKILCVSRYPNQNRHIPTIFLGSNIELFLSAFKEDVLINDSSNNIFEAIYFRLVNSVFCNEKTKDKIFWLDPILYENAVSSTGEPITYF